MSIYALTHILIYPIKSLGGISLNSAEIEERGLKYDRRWMLVNESNTFITQRNYPQLSLLVPAIENESLTISHKQNKLPSISVPLVPYNREDVNVQIWDDNVHALKYTGEINEWLSMVTGIKTKLVFMPDETKRVVDPDYTKNKIVSFADAYPFMMLGEKSLSELNSRLVKALPINRFRPNFVFSGGESFDEDSWKNVRIGDNVFNSVKSCARCTVTTVNQDTGLKGKEPLTTLSSFREKNGKVYFGINLTVENTGIVKVRDKLIPAR